MATYAGNSILAHAKAGCYICGRGDHITSLDVHIEGEGILALCTGCITDAAEAAGIRLNVAAMAEERAFFDEERRKFDQDAVAVLEQRLLDTEQSLANEKAMNARLLESMKAAPTIKAQPATRSKAKVSA